MRVTRPKNHTYSLVAENQNNNQFSQAVTIDNPQMPKISILDIILALPRSISVMFRGAILALKGIGLFILAAVVDLFSCFFKPLTITWMGSVGVGYFMAVLWMLISSILCLFVPEKAIVEGNIICDALYKIVDRAPDIMARAVSLLEGTPLYIPLSFIVMLISGVIMVYLVGITCRPLFLIIFITLCVYGHLSCKAEPAIKQEMKDRLLILFAKYPLYLGMVAYGFVEMIPILNLHFYEHDFFKQGALDKEF